MEKDPPAVLRPGPREPVRLLDASRPSSPVVSPLSMGSKTTSVSSACGTPFGYLRLGMAACQTLPCAAGGRSSGRDERSFPSPVGGGRMQVRARRRRQSRCYGRCGTAIPLRRWQRASRSAQLSASIWAGTHVVASGSVVEATGRTEETIATHLGGPHAYTKPAR